MTLIAVFTALTAMVAAAKVNHKPAVASVKVLSKDGEAKAKKARSN